MNMHRTCAKPACPCARDRARTKMNNTWLCFRLFIAFPVLFKTFPITSRGVLMAELKWILCWAPPDRGQGGTELSALPSTTQIRFSASLTGSFPRAQSSCSCHTSDSSWEGWPQFAQQRWGPWRLPSPSSPAELREAEAGNRWWGRLASPHAYFAGFAASHLL